MLAKLPVIETARLVLRPLVEADAGDLFAIRGDPEAMRFWDWPADQEPTETLARVQDFLAKPDAHYWSARRAGGTFIGLFDLSDCQDTTADLGFMIARRFWGQGFATEGARALVDEARRRHLVHLTARIHANNVASRRLLLRLGFAKTGPLRTLCAPSGRRIPAEHFIGVVGSGALSSSVSREEP